jgi:hypothetical protein
MTEQTSRLLPDPHEANELLLEPSEHLPFEGKLGRTSDVPDFEHMAERHYPSVDSVPDTVEGFLARVTADKELMKPWKNFVAQDNSSEERRVIGPTKLYKK